MKKNEDGFHPFLWGFSTVVLSSNSLVKTELLGMPWLEFIFYVAEAPVADFHKSHARKLLNWVSPKWIKTKQIIIAGIVKHMASELEIPTFLETIL